VTPDPSYSYDYQPEEEAPEPSPSLLGSWLLLVIMALVVIGGLVMLAMRSAG
jgi:hypothetical protein